MSGPSESSSATEITNVDERFAVQDGLGLSDSSIYGNISFNSTQAITDIAGMASSVINRASNNAAELTGYSINRNLDSLDNTINRSVGLVDSLIEQTYQSQQFAIEAANAQVAAANANAASQVYEANKQATKVTTDTLAGSRQLIGEQQAAINKLAADNTKLGFGLADVAIKAWTPTDNKALDAIKTMGMVAAAAAAAAFIFRAKKS
jgi:hypothetical protein